MRSRQLTFVFADSPQGGGDAGTSDASDAKAYLLRTAKVMPMVDLIAPATDTGQLLPGPWFKDFL
jgi:hypothetical protein